MHRSPAGVNEGSPCRIRAFDAIAGPHVDQLTLCDVYINGAGTEAPYLIDPVGGQLYLGNVRFEADPFMGFRKNLTTLRIECKALYHVRQPEGFRRIAAT